MNKMVTPLDQAMRSKVSFAVRTKNYRGEMQSLTSFFFQNAVLAFSGLVTGVALWAIWGGDLFPQANDPTGDPETWTREELRRWMAAVGQALGWTDGGHS